jgi:glucose 1-dehydrogenase
MNELEKRVAIVTGSGSGIGAATARKLAMAGAFVACADINVSAVRSVAVAIIADGGSAAAYELDVSSRSAWQELVSSLGNSHARIDILANCAGVASFSSLEAIEEREWRAVNAVNCDGPLLGIQATVPYLKQSDAGAVVNISSLAARVGATFGIAYSASKAALVGLTRSAAKYFNHAGYKCRCNVILPGYVETPLLQSFFKDRKDPAAAKQKALATFYERRAATAEEIAEAVLYLASPRSGYITGAELVVDGGMSA